MSPDLRIRDVLATDPITARIPNQGVANVNQDETIQDELRNFVCEGQYAKGLDRILDSYLSSLNSDEQPAVWVSGFYGSGKSHFVKMLTYLWTDRTFDDGASARGLVQIPDEITHHFRELSTRGKQAGGLTAAAGILDKNLSVELGLLSILFQAAGFSSQYHIARLQMWLRDQGVLAAVAKRVTDAGKDFGRELRNMHVSPVLADAILQEVPGLAADEKGVRDALLKEYAKTDKVTLDEMLDAIRDLLVVDDRIPCTLVVLDELQQYIGDSSDRSLQVQMVTEACCKRFGGRLLFIGTGQSALSETPNLQKLMGRFTVPVELSDADVETVIRRLLLAKKPDRLPAVKSFLQTHSGEIDRHLCGTLIAPRPEDSNNLATDYPILPVRQRFWERILRAIDKPGTAAQLRTQLRMVHEALRTVAESPLGAVVSADFIFDQQYQQMKQSGTLLRDIDDTIQKHRDGTPDGQLKSRLCALAFLIGLLPRDMGADIGLRARSDMIADLMVNDLADGGTELRKRIPELLEELAASGDLMKIGDEYRIQTRESAAWESEFRGLYAKKVNDPSFIASERNQLLHGRVGEIIAKLQPKHGKAKVPRKLAASYGSTTPVQDGESVPIWVRDGWEGSLNSVREDARQGGAQDPTVYVFLPHQDSDQLKESIAAWRAAEEVLAIRGMPTTDEGREAHSAMKSRMERHESEASRYADRVVGHATVLQGGGGEVAANDLQSAILDAAKNALVRLFPQFELADADSIAWGKVVERARKGDGDCLRVVGHSGNVPEHPVCKAIMGYLSTSRT
ncbi:MAG: BREX system P-loop protein BrxC, partial [Acidobacteriota bacterium]|nr:BREX system P-loop protein BrxC [Acidobacteriota bacterium]